MRKCRRSSAGPAAARLATASLAIDIHTILHIAYEHIAFRPEVSISTQLHVADAELMHFSWLPIDGLCLLSAWRCAARALARPFHGQYAMPRPPLAPIATDKTWAMTLTSMAVDAAMPAPATPCR